MISIELPLPPSANHYYRHVGPRTLISRGGRAFREGVALRLKAARVQPLSGRLAVQVDIYPPDERRRDIDNIQKALLDALQHGGAFHDDSQVVWLLTQKAQLHPGGKVSVKIWNRE